MHWGDRGFSGELLGEGEFSREGRERISAEEEEVGRRPYSRHGRREKYWAMSMSLGRRRLAGGGRRIRLREIR